MYRTLLNYPPVYNMLLVKFSSRYENRLNEAVCSVNIKNTEVQVIGPSNASLYKADDIYSKVIYYKTEEYSVLTDIKDELEQFIQGNELFRYVSVQFDFNPLND
jgi:primosomal protein N' (replication factor Y)